MFHVEHKPFHENKKTELFCNNSVFIIQFHQATELAFARWHSVLGLNAFENCRDTLT